MRRALLLTPLASVLALAQGAPAADLESELQALLNTPVTVASTKAMGIREAPGIITLVTREEILASGARDLMEALRLVPGFNFAGDVQGVVSIGVRGNWGTEGKVSVQLDGIEQNELRYNSLFFGNNFPLDQVSRIEIIRGPGSAIYGGTAELAVVNIITRGKELNGASADLAWSRTGLADSRRSASFGYGGSAGGLGYAVTAFRGLGNRSDRPFEMDPETAVPLSGRAYLDDTAVNASLDYRGFALRVQDDRYRVGDYTGAYGLGVLANQFNQSAVEAKYAWKLSDTLTLTPKATWRSSQGWYYPSVASNDKLVTRSTLGVRGSWDQSKDLNLVFGAEAFRDEGKARGEGETWADGGTTVSYGNTALYAQALWTAPWATVTLGGRMERNSKAGSSFVPRVGITKVLGANHFKILVAQAFRAPGVENLDLNPEARPEKTTTIEVEAGRQVSQQVFVSVNLFDIRIKDPLVYASTEDGLGTYRNYDKTGSRGLEAQVKFQGDFGTCLSTLSVYRCNGTSVPDYAVPGAANYLLGMPRVKFTLQGSFRMTDRLSFAPSLVADGAKYGYGPGDAQPRVYESSAVVNALLHYRLPQWKLLVSAGVLNLLDAPQLWTGGYMTSGPPVPGSTREYTVRLGYNL